MTIEPWLDKQSLSVPERIERLQQEVETIIVNMPSAGVFCLEGREIHERKRRIERRIAMLMEADHTRAAK